jgi:hypothetical protein
VDWGQAVLIICALIGAAAALSGAIWKVIGLVAKLTELIDLLPLVRNAVTSVADITRRLERLEARRQARRDHDRDHPT